MPGGRRVRLPEAVRRGPRSAVAVTISIWLLVYVVVCATGQRFSSEYLRFGWQLIPDEILNDNPISSVWYLHTQPPFWNLALGLVGWLSPLSTNLSVQLMMAGFGAGLAGACAAIGTGLRLRRGLAEGVALAVTVNSEMLALAFSPHYELPVACALAWMVAVLLGRRSPRRMCVTVVLLATAIVLTRSLYHPVWLVVVVAAVLIHFRGSIDRRTVAACVAVPALLVGGWLVKNQVLFGTATTSSWTGMNLLRSVQPVVSRAELRRLREDDEISGVGLTGAFLPYEQYEPFIEPCDPSHGHHAVADRDFVAKDFNGLPTVQANFNYECLIPVYQQATDDALAIIQAEPGAWAEGRVWSAQSWFASPSRTDADSPVLRFLDASETVTRIRIPWTLSMTGWGAPFFGADHIDLDITLASAFADVALFMVLVRRLRRYRYSPADERAVTFAVDLAAMILMWTFAIGIVGELGEQQRFRLMVEPLVMTLAVSFGLRWLTRHTPLQLLAPDIELSPTSAMIPALPEAAMERSGRAVR